MVADGMRIDYDVPIEMDDGLVLRCDVFRPVQDGRFPVIMTLGPYAKGLPFQTGYSGMWKTIEANYPEILQGSTNKYQNWETCDPEKWVPDGYVCVRVDSRGAGRSPGYLDVYSPRETLDYYHCIEWAGTQSWSNGKVGLLGISYYAVNQWLVAQLQPPHLAAICPFEGYQDFYRECNRHGGILNTFMPEWFPVQVTSVQYGNGSSVVNPNTGVLVVGGPALSEEELAANRSDLPGELRSRELDDPWYRARSAELSKITVPLLSAASWTHSLHERGNFEGYLGAASEQKWLEVHGLEHWTVFYTDYGVDLQKRFFGHFLKGLDTGWDKQPPVSLNLRAVDGTFVQRGEQEWPLARTQWTRLYLDAADSTLLRDRGDDDAAVQFAALGDGVTFLTEPLVDPLEITGPCAAKLFVSSSTEDADVFVVLRVLDPEGTDVAFVSAQDPRGVITKGWLRASHRKLDHERSMDYRPYHPHDEKQPLVPGEKVELDIEIWPTSVLIPSGYRLGVTVLGRDFTWPGAGPWPQIYGIDMRGDGIFHHNDPGDRPESLFGGTTTLYTGAASPSYLLLPVIPERK
ncbi:CocE/NonD family hydrolase [Conexibacter sp. S30A1]|uniref:CocE/NonD family hydrolase n=1 Tax=Conexibacter sp. S30A1 TaxID=2937800 RepID=UPI00200C0DF0|nr:CocE/NonD family hydrolase [Conexibacter sp. S30A1]